MAKEKATPKAKPTAKKATAAKKPAAKSATAKAKATRRPDPNEPPHLIKIKNITDDLMALVRELDNYAANLRALDRQRHNGVGMKRLGFIEAALRLAVKFPQYLPHWLTCSKALRTFELGVCA